MSTTTVTTELTSQYITQVADDIERNAKEQERVGAEISALQEQLLALQHDQTVLVNMQKALGTATAQPGSDAAAVPSARRHKDASAPGAGKRTRGRKAATVPGGRTPSRSGSRKSEATAADRKAAQPTLVELIRRYLTEQSEPRSAGEVSAALSQAHPERRVTTNVVRTTLEGLVAKGHAHRAKQGSSVFYTAAATEPGLRTQSAEAGAGA
jgi:hypothetical protein